MILSNSDRISGDFDLPVVQKPRGILPLGPVDVAPLEAILERFTESVWRTEDSAKPNEFSCFHSTRHVIFRFCRFNDARDFRSNPGWNIFSRSLLPTMDRASEAYGFAEPVYPKAMFASLAAGCRIDLHLYELPQCLHTHKIHIPVRTAPSAMLIVDGVEHHLRKGCAYEINNLLAHGAFNGGERDRVHFIFEVFEGRSGCRG